mgnify:CR=1 FL=1
MTQQSVHPAEVVPPAAGLPLARFRPAGRLRQVFLREGLAGYVFVAPWFIGFVVFTLGPFLASLYLSTLEWSLLGTAKFVGFGNFTKMFADDERYIAALKNTFIYVFVSVPLKQVIALTIAMLLSQELRAIFAYRTVFYLPSVTSGVATSVLWTQVFGFRMGILNAVLSNVGIQPIPWLTSLQWALPTLIFISLWNVGSIFIIYLAGLKGVPLHYYEAAEVDGASPWQKFSKITLPLITPTVFFNLVMGFIGSFKIFTQAYVMTGGGPADRTLFYVLYLFYKAFQDFRMGYASAMAWVLFIIILFFTMIQLSLSKRWVYYEGAAPGGQRV